MDFQAVARRVALTGCALAVTLCSIGVSGMGNVTVGASVMTVDTSSSEALSASDDTDLGTEESASVVSLETVAGTEDTEEQAAEQVNVKGLTAGVTTLITKTFAPSVTLTAGIASSLNDFDSGEVYIVEQEKIKVAAALEEEERIAREEAEAAAAAAEAAEKAANLESWGYENLGIASSESALNVRESASESSDIVGKMSYHTACEVISIEDGWAKISSGDVEGYVSTEYLLTGDEAYEVALEEVQTVATVSISERLRVRSEASTDSSILTNVSEGEELTVLDEESDGWLHVELDDIKGYVYAEYVEVSEKLTEALEVSVTSSYTSLSTYDIGSIAGTVSDTRYSLVETALQYVGNPYAWGGTSLTNGVDCSGFTMKIFAMYGISLPHSSKAQPSYGTVIDISEARPGDLFFYGEGSTISHVAIYIGNGKIVHASTSKSGIIVSNALYMDPICVVSYFND